MKILFVSTVPVFPPSDGVRIPPANYIRGLTASHEVDFLLLDPRRGDPNFDQDCAVTETHVRHFWRVSLVRGSLPLGILREVFAKGPNYGFWQLTEELPQSLVATEYDAVIACTPAAISIFSAPSIQSQLAGKPRWIAAISDLHSLVIARLAQHASKNHSILSKIYQTLIYGLRSKTLAGSEMTMLAQYDHHLVQSEKEVEWVTQKAPSLSARTVRLSNAVDDQLFDLPTARSGKRIAFVGVLSALYAGRFDWFLNQVWSKIDQHKHEFSLTAIGRGASEQLQQSMHEHDVKYVDFVENLSDIYRDHDILIAPIFKGFGLINKVVEALAAGCIVVGDETAFNGIPDFTPGKHGFVANTAEEFQDVFDNDFADSARLDRMREDARKLMQQHFRWSQRIEMLEKKVLSN